MTAEHGHPEQINGIAEGWWICLPDCRNESALDGDGFVPSDEHGRPVDPVAGAWDGKTCVCQRCGRIFDQTTGDVTGVRAADLVTEMSTCGNCAGRIELRGVWQHVTDDHVSLRCHGTHSRAVPVDPRDTPTLLGIILINLRVVGASEINLYADGFEISGPDDTSLLFVGGTYSPAGVATWLHVPVDAIADLRDQETAS